MSETEKAIWGGSGHRRGRFRGKGESVALEYAVLAG